MTNPSVDLDLHGELLPRFLRYVRIDTQSDEESPSYPSTEKQLVLLRLLAAELRELGLVDVSLDQHGYVTATLLSSLTPTDPQAGRIPVIGLLAHVDTSPSMSGTGVNPQIVRAYAGGDVQLPNDPSQTIRVAEYPALLACVGHDLITTDGTTLLGADDKAGVAEIVTAVGYLARHPEIPHGKIRVGFTPDEEVGRGTEHFDLAAFGADYAYTVDGGEAGEVEDETFSADTLWVTIKGHSVHPGYAKGKLVNGVKLAAELLGLLPRERLSPETTDGREGYLHPERIEGGVEETRIKFIVRDFSLEGLQAHEDLVRELVERVAAGEPRAAFSVEVEPSYRNMKAILDQHPPVVAYAEEAVRRAGLTPIRRAIRGGTDGARLSAAGLPTPNLFTGGHGFHSKQEWISLQQMGQAVETLVHLARIWCERA